MTFVFQFMLMLVSLYGLKMSEAGAVPVPLLDPPLDEPPLDEPPLDDEDEVPPPDEEDELLPPHAPPLLPPLLPPLEEPLDEPPPPAHVTGCQSAGTASGVQPGSLVCACVHSHVSPS
jgi:hypothetical protein